ncbi:MAG: CDP-alcohol phosphatidyltransferase family protein [Clostridiales bacterium]|jgi:cardiolipin synthase|nr:CDP-alcohol phosphatidyltransferase family protein [Clostridiales bacterium]
MKSQLKDLFTPPNIITMARIVLIPVFAVVMFQNMFWGLILFLVCASTDLLDGYVARRFNMVSRFGKLLDPIADKLMHVTVLICLGVIFANTHPPYYILTVLLFFKELIQLLLGFLLLKRKVVISANWYGKSASFVLSVGVVLAFAGNYSYTVYVIGFVFSAIGVALSYLAFATYAMVVLKQFDRKMPKGDKKIEIDPIKQRTKIEDEGK